MGPRNARLESSQPLWPNRFEAGFTTCGNDAAQALSAAISYAPFPGLIERAQLSDTADAKIRTHDLRAEEDAHNSTLSPSAAIAWNLKPRPDIGASPNADENVARSASPKREALPHA